MAGSGFKRRVPAGVSAPTMPGGLQPPAHRYKSTAKGAMPKAPKPKAMAAQKPVKSSFLNESPMDKSAMKPPKIPKAKKPPAVKKPKGFPTL